MNPENDLVKKPQLKKRPLFILIVILIIFFGLIIRCVMDLWNTTLPELFGLKEITYFQTFRLVVLSHLLFGSSQLWKSK